MSKSHFSAPSHSSPLSANQFRQRLDNLDIKARSDERQLPNETASAQFVAAAMARGAGGLPAVAAAGDPIERLPAAAGEKLRGLRQANEDAGVLIRELSGRKTELIQRKQRSQQRYLELTDDEAAMRAGTVTVRRSPLRPGGSDNSIPGDDEHPAIIEVRRELESASREMQDIDQRIANLTGQRWTGLRSRITFVASYREGRSRPMTDPSRRRVVLA
jgi:hypothetical protein